MMTYLGSPFVGYFMICCIAQLTKTKISPAMQWIGIGFGTIILFLSMTSVKEKLNFEQVFSIIRESSGSHFDPFLCEQFLACKDHLISVYSADLD